MGKTAIEKKSIVVVSHFFSTNSIEVLFVLCTPICILWKRVAGCGIINYVHFRFPSISINLQVQIAENVFFEVIKIYSEVFKFNRVSNRFTNKLIVGSPKPAKLFETRVKTSFEDFINQRQNKPAEMIAKFFDSKLRTGYLIQFNIYLQISPLRNVRLKAKYFLAT